MNEQELKSLWKSQPLAVESVSLAAVRAAAGAFEARLRRRDRQEQWAGILAVLVFAAFAWQADGTTLRAGCVLIVLGTLAMLYQLRRRAAIASPPERGLAGTHVDHFRAELVRQRDALRAIWLWGVAPALPGVAVLVWGMAENDPAGFPWLPMASMFVVPAAVVMWMNVKAARRLQREIDALDAAAR